MLHKNKNLSNYDIFENPEAIRHFQSICDSCQDLVTRFHTPSDLKLYSDGYLALRNCNSLERRDQENWKD